jgi:hypothetical protein
MKMRVAFVKTNQAFDCFKKVILYGWGKRVADASQG